MKLIAPFLIGTIHTCLPSDGAERVKNCKILGYRSPCTQKVRIVRSLVSDPRRSAPHGGQTFSERVRIEKSEPPQGSDLDCWGRIGVVTRCRAFRRGSDSLLGSDPCRHQGQDLFWVSDFHYRWGSDACSRVGRTEWESDSLWGRICVSFVEDWSLPWRRVYDVLGVGFLAPELAVICTESYIIFIACLVRISVDSINYDKIPQTNSKCARSELLSMIHQQLPSLIRPIAHWIVWASTTSPLPKLPSYQATS
jgi:hypothetical protein